MALINLKGGAKSNSNLVTSRENRREEPVHSTDLRKRLEVFVVEELQLVSLREVLDLSLVLFAQETASGVQDLALWLQVQDGLVEDV